MFLVSAASIPTFAGNVRLHRDGGPSQPAFPKPHGGKPHAARSVPDRARVLFHRPAPPMRRRPGGNDADGYAIGGLSVGEPRPLSMEAVEATEHILPQRFAS
jgi:hypothetical protein